LSVRAARWHHPPLAQQVTPTTELPEEPECALRLILKLLRSFCKISVYRIL
jgi:hypothetical protein